MIRSKVGHDELAKIRSYPAGLTSLSGLVGPDCRTGFRSDAETPYKAMVLSSGVVDVFNTFDF
jgi:hypothetical protein